MKLNREDLANVLSTLKPALIGGDRPPILESIYFDKKYVYAYNYSIGIILPFETESELLVPFDQFEIFVRNSTAEEINIEIENDQALLECGKSKAVVPFVDGDYPDFLKIIDEIEDGFSLTGDTFSVGAKLCLPFLSSKVARVELTGIHITKKFIEATDGMRIARYIFPDELEVDFDSIVLPQEILKASLKMGEIERSFIGENYIIFDFGNALLFGNLIEGGYPDVSNFFPNVKKFIEFPRDELKKALVKVGDFTGEVCFESTCEIELGDTIIIRHEGTTARITEFLDFGKLYPKGKFVLNPYHFSVMLDNCDLFSFQETSLFGRSQDSSFKCLLALNKVKK